MRIRHLILPLNLLFYISCSGQKATEGKCQCDEMEVIYQLQEKGNKTLIVCGFSDEKQEVSEKIVSSLLIKDCKNDKIVIDYSNDEIYKHILSKDGQKIKVFSIKLILKGDEWQYDFVKETEQTVFIEKEEVKLSESKNVFIVPTLTLGQKNDLSKLCKSLRDILKEHNKPAYPNDEKSIYMLYMGALNNDEESKYFLQNLRNLFEVDGAIAETLSEVGF